MPPRQRSTNQWGADEAHAGDQEVVASEDAHAGGGEAVAREAVACEAEACEVVPCEVEACKVRGVEDADARLAKL
eukprot:7821920-Alexandrium_andersonii.AAC.1